MKRLLSLAIAVCIIIGIVTVAPISIGAVETQKVTTGAISGDYRYKLLGDGTAEISRYTGSDTSITIPSQIDGYTVTSIGSIAFSGCESLASITIPDSVTNIGYESFYVCTNLTSITIPDSVTSIGSWAFFGCTSLISITIPDSVTNVGYQAFYGTAWYNSQPDGLVYAGKVAYMYKGKCPSEVIIKDGTKDIAVSSFSGCTSLTNITIPNSVTTIGDSAFKGCSSLTSITIPDSVTTIGDDAFYNCTSLTSITIPDSVTTIGRYAFYGTAWYNNQPGGLVYAGKVAYEYKGECPTEVIIKDGTKSICSCAFSYCESLTSITIPDSVTTIGGWAFEDCTSLTSITIPDSVTTIGDYAFMNCTSLTSITIPDSVTTIGEYAFSDCTSLTTITIPDSVTTIGGDAFYGTEWYNNQPDGLIYAGKIAYEYKGDCPSEVIIKDGTRSISCYTFFGCASLTKITIPDSVTTIDDHALGYCYDYDSEEYIKIDNFIIYGYPDSAAEKYANDNCFTFLNVSEMPTTSSTEPTTTEPTTTEPTTTEPSTTEPSTTKPVPTQPTTRPATVKKTTVTLAKSSATVYRTGKTTIKATVKNGKGKTTYKSSNTKIAKVTSNGVVTGVSKGTAKITVTNNGVKKVFTVKVNNPTLNKNSVSIKKGKTFTLKIAGKIGKAKFTSSNKKIATVNTNGKITAKKKGTVTIKVKTNGITLVCKVKVK